MLNISVAPSLTFLLIGYLFYGKCGKCEKYRWFSFIWKMRKMWKLSVAPSVTPLLNGYMFYGKCRKCEKYRWLPRWLPCSLAICFMEKLENVKNIGGSYNGSLVHWLSVLWKMWKMRKISVAPSLAFLLIAYQFYGKWGKCENIGGFLGGFLAPWLFVLW